MLLQLAGVAFWRNGLADWKPWLLVSGLALVNEVHDLWLERWPHLGMQFGEGLKDIVLTILLPSLLLLLARRSSILTPDNPLPPPSRT